MKGYKNIYKLTKKELKGLLLSSKILIEQPNFIFHSLRYNKIKHGTEKALIGTFGMAFFNEEKHSKDPYDAEYGNTSSFIITENYDMKIYDDDYEEVVFMSPLSIAEYINNNLKLKTNGDK